MEEQNRFIINEYGEVVKVTEEEYQEYMEDHPEFGDSVHTFQAPDQEKSRSDLIDNVIEGLNQEHLTEDEMLEIEDNVHIKTQEDRERENREKLDDDIKNFQTSQQREALEGKDAKIQSIVMMLNQLNLSEEEMAKIENEVQRYDKTNTDDKKLEEKKDER